MARLGDVLLERHAMGERQKQFRATYMAEISRFYNGPVHIGVIYVVGIAAISWCVARLHGATWEWLLVVPVFVLSNLFEWWIHKNVMHRLVDVWALRAIYDRHSRQHHQYFTDNEMTVDSTREWRIIFFPWRALFTFMGLGVPFALLLAWLVNPNAGYILMVTIVGQYLIYETFHYCCHVHDNWFVRYTPFINTIRRHHTMHHNKGHHDGRQHEPHLPDRRLDDGHQRSRPRTCRPRVQRLQHATREARAAGQSGEVPQRGAGHDRRAPGDGANGLTAHRSINGGATDEEA